MGAVAVANLKVSLKKIEELVAGMDVGANVGAFASGDKFGKVGVELAVGDHVGQALEVVSRVVDAGLGEADALGAAMDAEERVGLGLEEVGEVAAEDHGDAGEVAEGGDDAAGFKLGEKAGGEAGVAAQFDEAHGALEAEAADAFANAFFGDEGFGGGRVGGGGIEVGGGGFVLAFHSFTQRGPCFVR